MAALFRFFLKIFTYLSRNFQHYCFFRREILYDFQKIYKTIPPKKLYFYGKITQNHSSTCRFFFSVVHFCTWSNYLISKELQPFFRNPFFRNPQLLKAPSFFFNIRRGVPFCFWITNALNNTLLNSLKIIVKTEDSEGFSKLRIS